MTVQNLTIKDVLEEAGVECNTDQLVEVTSKLQVRRAAKNQKFFVVGDEDLQEKCAVQMRKIYESLDETPRTGAEIADIAVSNGLKTRQDPARIFAWYRGDLLNSGAMVEADRPS